jgi:hypothetical protein
MNNHSTIRLLSAIAAGAMAVLAPVAIAPVASAQTDTVTSCTHPSWSDKDTATGSVTKDGTIMHTGPNADCPQVVLVHTSAVLEYDCYVLNSSGNTWTHVYARDTGLRGWIYDGYLNDGGSIKLC